MTLSDGDIRIRLATGDLVIKPIDDPEFQIQPASVDLRLHNKIMIMNRFEPIYIDTKNIVSYTEDRIIHPTAGFDIQPQQFILGSTIEYVEIPDDLVAEVHGKSTFGRLGLAVHVTAGFVDPGFKGNITLEMVNLGSIPIRIYAGMRICQLKIAQLMSTCERPYGKDRGSRYKYQLNVTPAKKSEVPI